MKSETFAIGDKVFVFDSGLKITETTIIGRYQMSGTYTLEGYLYDQVAEEFLSKDKDTLSKKMAKYAKDMNDPKKKHKWRR